MKIFSSIALAALASAPTAALAQSHDGEFPWLYERKILGVNNLEPIEAAKGTEAYDFSRVVARVEKLDGFGFCTASRVGQDLFLTNYHCDQPCDTMQFDMGYEKEVAAGDRQTFRCKKLLHKNEAYDYALYQVEAYVPDGSPDNEANYPVLKLWNGPIEVKQKVLVASHPSGRTKEIDRSDECVLTSVEPFLTDSGRNTIKHMCDTEGGSSGAPVLDRATGMAIALHWGGKDGQFNMAIPMRLVLKDMQANVPADVYQQLSIED